MTPPLCSRPGCGRRVRPLVRTAPAKMGVRVVGGQRWRWFCGMSCASRARDRRQWRVTVEAAVAARKAKAEQAAIRGLVALVRGAVTEDGYVPVKALIKAYMLDRRRVKASSYYRGLLAGRQERRRWVREVAHADMV